MQVKNGVAVNYESYTLNFKLKTAMVKRVQTKPRLMTRL